MMSNMENCTQTYNRGTYILSVAKLPNWTQSQFDRREIMRGTRSLANYTQKIRSWILDTY